MATYKKSEIMSGVFILLALAVFTLFAFKVGGWDLFGFASKESRQFQTLLLETETLQPGAKVTVGGVRVGTVTAMRLATEEETQDFLQGLDASARMAAYPEGIDPRVLVSFNVENDHFDDVPFRLSRLSSRVFLQQEGFLGPHYLQVDPGRVAEDGVPVFEGDQAEPFAIAAENKGLLAVLMKELRPTQVRVNTLLDRINEGVLSKENMDNMSLLLKNLVEATESGNRILAQVEELLGPGPNGITELILVPGSNLLSEIKDSVSLVKSSLRTSIIPKIAGILDNGSDGLEELRAAVRRVDGVVAANAPSLEQILQNLVDGTADLDKRLNRTEATLQDLARQLSEVLTSTNGVIADNRAEIAEVMRSMRRLTWEMEVLVRKVRSNPGVVLWGDDEVPLEAMPTDRQRHRRAGRAAPFGQRDENDGK